MSAGSLLGNFVLAAAVWTVLVPLLLHVCGSDIVGEGQNKKPDADKAKGTAAEGTDSDVDRPSAFAIGSEAAADSTSTTLVIQLELHYLFPQPRTSISATATSANEEDGIITLHKEAKNAEPASAVLLLDATMCATFGILRPHLVSPVAVCIILPGVLNIPENRHLFTRFADNCPHSFLTTLTIKNPGVTIQYPPDPQKYRLDITTLRILFCFRNLTCVVIECPLGFELEDSAMLDMAQAWPHIESLQMRFHDATPAKPSATLGCLHYFAWHCRVLRVMALDATVVPPTDGISMQNCLEQLHVFESPLSSVRDVACYLSGLFPKLRNVGYKDEDGDDLGWLIDEGDRWSEVEAAIINEN
ncbi:hypothetical protein B0H13DRAFT_1887211 [Mycena leptocephala]|nr:hypothetical protein B0H13DRAFT_1887211 [Mycena leptocephala]